MPATVTALSTLVQSISTTLFQTVIRKVLEPKTRSRSKRKEISYEIQLAKPYRAYKLVAGEDPVRPGYIHIHISPIAGLSVPLVECAFRDVQFNSRTGECFSTDLLRYALLKSAEIQTCIRIDSTLGVREVPRKDTFYLTWFDSPVVATGWRRVRMEGRHIMILE
ncbi:hypothetical protein EXIGLDRAFT_216250 [Exidia glandulosa HHB12029]|uniref:Uncharacterized protein n=1 Tax=Exidia glandulosa HHB12029 TaxID=1314781 RepID=A0A165EGC6_EXIGL|nr:hypothetical protein EXIGLDRAFT_216250 [Exidia glandulosa HHB12029]